MSENSTPGHDEQGESPVTDRDADDAKGQHGSPADEAEDVEGHLMIRTLDSE